MYPGITLHGMRQKVFAGKFEIVLHLGSTQKGQIILQNLGFSKYNPNWASMNFLATPSYSKAPSNTINGDFEM